MASVTLKDIGSDFHRVERFDGGDFVCWQKKMHFLLVTVKVYYVIVNPGPPEPSENEEESVAKTRERLRWDQDDEICRGHILNGMSNTLFDSYHTVKTAKELWNQLERRYITEDATSKRLVMEQFNEIKTILDRYSQHKKLGHRCNGPSAASWLHMHQLRLYPYGCNCWAVGWCQFGVDPTVESWLVISPDLDR
ncbi:hypothetical protein RJ639_037979 [Escallonia herrerae]|uniref:Uncharacterized protein n=1 Tax=Escallonia herrerae TaxID=1293975 RepID=A0AA88WKG4_9ASTE|nr:hypothetical protein RJ639_037979 [Escallonia herrerae]